MLQRRCDVPVQESTETERLFSSRNGVGPCIVVGSKGTHTKFFSKASKSHEDIFAHRIHRLALLHSRPGARSNGLCQLAGMPDGRPRPGGRSWRGVVHPLSRALVLFLSPKDRSLLHDGRSFRICRQSGFCRTEAAEACPAGTLSWAVRYTGAAVPRGNPVGRVSQMCVGWSVYRRDGFWQVAVPVAV